LTPDKDYLCDRGRTRVLVYPLGALGHAAVTVLARRIFLDVYRMRRGDTLTYQGRRI
jgi:hypothetical protein